MLDIYRRHYAKTLHGLPASELVGFSSFVVCFYLQPVIVDNLKVVCLLAPDSGRHFPLPAIFAIRMRVLTIYQGACVRMTSHRAAFWDRTLRTSCMQQNGCTMLRVGHVKTMISKALRARGSPIEPVSTHRGWGWTMLLPSIDNIIRSVARV